MIKNSKDLRKSPLRNRGGQLKTHGTEDRQESAAPAGWSPSTTAAGKYNTHRITGASPMSIADISPIMQI